MQLPSKLHSLLLFFSIVTIVSCNNISQASEEEAREAFNVETSNKISQYLKLPGIEKGQIEDSITLECVKVVDHFYRIKNYRPVWSDSGKWENHSLELIKYYERAALDGLYKNHYHYNTIQTLLGELKKDNKVIQDHKYWAKADVVLTDAFMHILSDLKQGRLLPDSLKWKNDTAKFSKFFISNLDSLCSGQSLNKIFQKVQPQNKDYWELKKGIPDFLSKMDRKITTYVRYPFIKGNASDSLRFINSLKLRLQEAGELLTSSDIKSIDSVQLSKAIKQYQQKNDLFTDGKYGSGLVRSLNLTDMEKFVRISITLDRYKLMQQEMPSKCIWVNLPGFYLKVMDAGSVQLKSKIICGRPSTPTPTLNSIVDEMVIYPTWTVPPGIISGEILPGLKRNPGILARRGLKLYNSKGEIIDPYSVSWDKFSRGIPYSVQQSSGDNNALGVMKFNFANPHFVYLHDTNQRYLFNNSYRALSHGCIRVEGWKELSHYLANNESVESKLTVDSINNWLSYKKRRNIQLKNKIPIFISYFTCEGENGKIIFHDDIYNDDQKKKETFFADKNLIF